MRRILYTLVLIPLIFTLLPGQEFNAEAQGESPSTQEPASGSVLCQPGVYPTPPDGCLPLGPSEYLTQLAASGITLPIRPLPAFPPGANLNSIPYYYTIADPHGAPLFGSLEDAQADQNAVQSLPPGRLYLSFINVVEDQGRYYQLRSGLWLRSHTGTFAVPSFQGLRFSSTPSTAFGWVLGTIVSRTAPGLGNPETGKAYYRYQVVHIFATQTANEETWDMIGPDEWVVGRDVGAVFPRTARPDGVPADRWIEVNLQEQTLAVYDQDRLVFATLVASGVDPFWTRPGVFQIYQKKETETMSGSTAADRSDYYYIQDVPWTMYFDDARALHGAYWHNGFGYPRSHGCVNLSVGDAHWLFDWANAGDYVYVYDPSGVTPTDPSLYGNGAP
jgi:hypothetical protein